MVNDLTTKTTVCDSWASFYLDTQIHTQLHIVGVTLQGINISHLGKRKIIFKSAVLGGYVSSLEGIKYSTVDSIDIL